MPMIGTLCAIGAGIFYGFIGPLTKIAYNLGAGIGLVIILRYIIASILIIPALIINKPTYNIYRSQICTLILFTVGSILFTSMRLLIFLIQFFLLFFLIFFLK